MIPPQAQQMSPATALSAPQAPPLPTAPSALGAQCGQAMCSLPLTVLGTCGEHLCWVRTAGWTAQGPGFTPPPTPGDCVEGEGTGADGPYNQARPPQPPDRHRPRHSPTGGSFLPGNVALPIIPGCAESGGWL